MEFRNLEYLVDRAARAAAEAERHGFSETAKALRSVFSEAVSPHRHPNGEPGTLATHPSHKTSGSEDLTAL